MKHLRILFQHGAYFGAIVALFGGCAVGPDFVRPAPPETKGYTNRQLPPNTVAADGKVQRFTSDVALTADWWRLFKSAQLDAIVQQAIANNPTLEASEASLRQSQDKLRAGHGVYFPQIEAGVDARRQRSAPQQQGTQASGTIFNLITLSGTSSYAFDVFGGERRIQTNQPARAGQSPKPGTPIHLLLRHINMPPNDSIGCVLKPTTVISGHT